MPAGSNELRAVLLDVGGTIWPDRFAPIEGRDALLISRLCQALPELSRRSAVALLEEFDVRLGWRTGDLTQDTDTAVQDCATRVDIRLSPEEATRARRALCVPVAGHIEPFAGAREMLAAISVRGLRAVVVSNGITRDAIAYMDDFEALGLARYIDAVISSVDLGYLKPHPAIFAAALDAAQCGAEHCVMVGNSEVNDIAPAKALGMRTVRVGIEEPLPAKSAADAIVTSLPEIAAILDEWCR